MSDEPTDNRVGRLLAGTTVLQAVPALQDDMAGRAALRIAIGLLRAGARALVVGGGGPLVGELQALGGEWIELDFAAGSLFRRGRSARALTDIVTTEAVDLVHAYGADAARTAARALPHTPARLVTTYAGAPPPASWRGQPHDAMAGGQRVITASAFAAGLIAERHRIPPERVAVIAQAVDTDRFDPAAVSPERVAALRYAWHIDPNSRVVLAPGRLGPARGQLTLVDAERILVNGGLRRTVFVIAGDAADADSGEAIDRRIEAQGLRPIFRRVGHCDDMPAAYALADLVALPTERPSIFSAIAAEAQAMGRPLIASNIGALPELVRAPPRDPEASRTGWLVHPRDPLDLARTLAAALALGPEARQAMIRRARRFAETNFSPERVAAATLAVYGALLDNAGL